MAESETPGDDLDWGKDEESASRKEWLAHSTTQKLVKETKGDLINAQSELLGAAMHSTDPDVRGAYMKYVMTKASLEILMGKDKK